MKRLVAIGSGKGGVGKTWFAISLAHALARLGRRILLVDGDVGLANVDVQLGLGKGPDLGAVLASDRSITASIRAMQTPGFDILPGRSGSGATGALDLKVAERLLAEFGTLDQRYDLIVLDLPSGIDVGMRRLMMAADDAVIVTTEEPTALTDAYALMKATRKHQPDFLPKIVVNLVASRQAGQRIFDGLSRVCDRFLAMRPLSLGTVRRDRHVAEAISRQTPLIQCYPNCYAAQDVMAVARVLVDPAPVR